jgi:hypothetical protein
MMEEQEMLNNTIELPRISNNRGTKYTFIGYPYNLLKACQMPRIHDVFLDCVVYLYRTKDDAEDGERAGGSGFVVAIPFKSDIKSGMGVHFVVTNRHVIKEAPVVRLNTKDGNVSVIDLKEEQWIAHPDGDDIAVCAINLDRGTHKFAAVSPSNFITKELIDKEDIGIGDDIFVVGRFINHEGIQKNSPSVRFGSIAQMPGDKIRQNTGFEQESFLIEAKSIGGYSGAPVFLHILPFSSRPEKYEPSKLKVSSFRGPWLLGIDWGHLTSIDEVVDFSGDRIGAHGNFVKSNTGMMCVVPAWKLSELFESVEVTEFMDNVEQKWIKDKAWAPGQTDSKNHSIDLSPLENPDHREDFNNLLDAAVKGKQ